MTVESWARLNAALADLTEHLKSMDTVCTDVRMSVWDKVRQIKKDIGNAQNCLKTMVEALGAD